MNGLRKQLKKLYIRTIQVKNPRNSYLEVVINLSYTAIMLHLPLKTMITCLKFKNYKNIFKTLLLNKLIFFFLMKLYNI